VLEIPLMGDATEVAHGHKVSPASSTRRAATATPVALGVAADTEEAADANADVVDADDEGSGEEARPDAEVVGAAEETDEGVE
jgi:hypothetical protein